VRPGDGGWDRTAEADAHEAADGLVLTRGLGRQRRWDGRRLGRRCDCTWTPGRSLESKRPAGPAGKCAVGDGALSLGARAGCLALPSRATLEAERAGEASAQWGACRGLGVLSGGGADGPPMSTPGAMHRGPHRRPTRATQRPRRADRGAPGMEGASGSQEGVSVPRSDHRKRLCGWQRTSGGAALCEPRLGACPHRACLGGVHAQPAGVASFLKSEATRKGATSRTRTNCGIKPDDLFRRWSIHFPIDEASTRQGLRPLRAA
jgi:hypothetical protein